MGNAKKVTVMYGFVPVHTKMEVAVDEESSDAHAVCTGINDESRHAPVRVKQSVACPVCEVKHTSVWGFPQRGVEREGEMVVLTDEEIRGALGEPRTGRKDKPPVEIAFHPREKVFAATVAADSVQNMYPDRGGEKAYTLLRDALASHPEIVGVMIWAPSTRNALWVLEVVGSRIVASKRHWPEMVRATTEIPPVDVLDLERAMVDQLIVASVEDFDLGKYVDQSKLSMEELIASRAGTAPATVSATGQVGNPAVTDLLAGLQASLDAIGASKAPAKPAVKRAPAKKAVAKKAPARKRATKKAAAPLAKAG